MENSKEACAGLAVRLPDGAFMPAGPGNVENGGKGRALGNRKAVYPPGGFRPA